MNSNLEKNKSKVNIDTGNSNLNNQYNYKNINTNPTDKIINNNKKYLQYIKPLLLLLQKSEQILSIINLPTSSIDKYNKLKEISFKKCGLEYTPLVKNNNMVKDLQKENKANNNNIEKNSSKDYKIIQELSLSKNKLLDLILTFIETNKFININSNNNSKDSKSFLDNSNEFNKNCNILKEEINSIIKDKNIKNNTQNNSEDNSIFRDKEKLINYISRSQQNLTSVLCENDKKYNELKEAFLVQNSKNEFLNKYLYNINDLIIPIWNKYYNNEVDWFDPNQISDSHELKVYTKCHFLLNFMNQLFTDNKNLMEALNEMEKEKNEVFEKNESLKNIEQLLGKLNCNMKEKNRDIDMNKLINDGKELIKCIKEKIIEKPEKQKEKNNNNDENVEEDLYNNYNDDMNIFLGKLMNGIQNILNKVDISNKKNELIENMIKVNMTKNKNLSPDNSNFNMANTNMSNFNMSNTNMNMNISNASLTNIANNGPISKDISYLSSNNNNDINNSKLLMSSQVYKKKINHISGSNVIINNSKNDIFYNEKKNKYDKFDKKTIDLKKQIVNKIILQTQKDNRDNNDKTNNNILNKNFIDNNNDFNDKKIIENQNNVIAYEKIKKDKFENEVINEEKSNTLSDIENNLPEGENIQKIKNEDEDNNFLIIDNNIEKENKEKKIKNDNNNVEDNVNKEGLEESKNKFLEDFKLNKKNEKENDD